MENGQMEAVRSVKKRGADKWFAHFLSKIFVLWNILWSESKTEQTANKTYAAEDRLCLYKGNSAGWGVQFVEIYILTTKKQYIYMLQLLLELQIGASETPKEDLCVSPLPCAEGLVCPSK